MKILYCYRLNKDTGEILLYCITEYQETNKEITFKDSIGNKKVTQHTVPVENLNKFLYNTVFTFNPDPSFAFTIIKDYYRNLIQEYGEKIDKVAKFLNQIDRVNLTSERE